MFMKLLTSGEGGKHEVTINRRETDNACTTAVQITNNKRDRTESEYKRIRPTA